MQHARQRHLFEVSVGKPEERMTTLGDLSTDGRIFTSMKGK
jgi:hypothetical protein